jgi:hypothetical protein
VNFLRVLVIGILQETGYVSLIRGNSTFKRGKTVEMKTRHCFAVRAPSRHRLEFVVLVLLLLLLLERAQMTEPIFDFERLDVYRLAIDRCV